VRHHFCAASDKRTKNPELAKIGFQVQREAGEAQQQEVPGPAGTIVHNVADQTVTVDAMPDGASFNRVYRQVLGGDPEIAGVSNTTTVSVTQIAGPLTPGATYEFWLVGVNSAGEGPESNHVTHTVPVAP